MARHWITSLNNGDTDDTSRQAAPRIDDCDALSLPMVMLATIFLRTVLRLVNFLSLDSAACNSARNSYVGPIL